MLFSLLGPLEVSSGDTPVRFGEGRERGVLILLLLHRNELVASERLIDDLWGDTPPATAAKVLQNHVGRIRRALDDRKGRRLQTRGHAYVLRVEDGELDIDRFERLVRESGDALADDRPVVAADRLHEALALWRGPPLADVEYEAFAQPEIARLQERRIEAVERRVDADLALGRHHDLVAELGGLVAQHPLREGLRGQRMLALYRCGRQAEALQAYREARSLLIEQIGVEPGADLRELHERILRQDPALELAPVELPKELEAATTSEMAGRDSEMAWLRERWERARDGHGAMVVLVGERGMGKTRLAAELACEVHRAGWPVVYAVRDVGGALRQALGATRPALVVLDDAEPTEGGLVAARELAAKPVLIVAAVSGREGARRLGAEESLALSPLDLHAVARITESYAPDGAPGDAPALDVLERSGGNPCVAHDLARAWARSDARSRVGVLAERAAAGRTDLRTAEAGIAQGVLDLQAAHGRGNRFAARDQVVCPFKGLASFEAGDAEYFFGRERLVAELVARAVGAPLLAVVGPSGSGKSSVVKAGLLSSLAGGVLPGSGEWPQEILRPGDHPLGELGAAGLTASAGDHAVLAVDQFEEVFTACTVEDEREAFIDALVRVARAGGLVVLALRADHYGRCAAYPALSKLLEANHVLVGPMSREDLRRAIEMPAQLAGLHVEPELVDALLADIEDKPGGLPLLSTALLELWQRRDGKTLRSATYELIGGVRGAVGRLAEDAYGRLEPEQRGIARTLLLRLADEGVGGEVARRRVALADLEASSSGDLARVLELLTERRLLTMSATTVEVAHEALFREWPRLRGWLEEDAQGRRTHARLTDAAREWDAAGRDPSDVYRGARLAVALEWRDGHDGQMSHIERAFLDTSRAAADRAQRRLRLALAGVAALLALALAGGLAALHQGGTARAAARAAEAQQISAQALTDGDLDRSLLMARQGVALADSPVTRGNLLAALLRYPAAIAVVHPRGSPLRAIDISPNGRALAVGDRNGTLELIDARTGGAIAPPRRVATTISQVRFSPDGRRLAVAGMSFIDEGFVGMFDAATGRSLGELAIGLSKNVFIEGVGDVAFSADSRIVAADYSPFVFKTGPHYLLRWNARTRRRLAPRRPITATASSSPALGGFVAHGTQLVTSSAADASTVIRDARTLRPVRELAGGGTPAAISPDGRLAALIASNGSARLLDLRTGESRTLGARNGAPVTAMRFTADSRRLVIATTDARLTIWDTRRAAPIATVDRLTSTARQLAISPDGATAYTAGDDGSVVAWDLIGTRWLGRPFRIRPRTPSGLALLTPTGPAVAVAYDRGDIDLLDGRTPMRAARIATMAAGGSSRPRSIRIAIAPDGHTIATGTADGEVRFASARTGRPLGPPTRAHIGAVLALAFSPDGAWLATSGEDHAIYVWDVRQQTPKGLTSLPGAPASSLSVSPDGTKLAATTHDDNGAGELDILAIPRLTLLAHVAVAPGAQTQFSRDGRLLFYGDDTGRIWILDTRTGKPRGGPLGGSSGTGRFALTPDDRLLATTSTDGTTQLWDVRSGRPIGTALPGVAGQAVSAAFIEGGADLVTIDRHGRGDAWDLRPTSWERRACNIAGRTLTRAEWHEALPQRHYSPACPG